MFLVQRETDPGETLRCCDLFRPPRDLPSQQSGREARFENSRRLRDRSLATGTMLPVVCNRFWRPDSVKM